MSILACLCNEFYFCTSTSLIYVSTISKTSLMNMVFKDINDCT